MFTRVAVVGALVSLGVVSTNAAAQTGPPTPGWYPGAPAFQYPPPAQSWNPAAPFHSVAEPPRNPAYAPDPRTAWDRRPLAFVAEIGGPLGLAATFEGSPARWFTVAAGVGITFFGPHGGFRTRFRTLGEHHAAYVGPGFSVGDLSSCVMFCEHETEYRRWSPAYLLDGELGYEYRADGGFTLRAYLGASKILNVSAGRCGDRGGGSVTCPPEILGSGGIALGYAFGS